MKKLIFIMILASVSCGVDNETKIDNSDLIGNWNWTNTDGGIGFHIHKTPESTGKIIFLNLNPDYEFSVTENEIEIANGIYELILEKSIYSGKTERFIKLLTIDQQHLDFVKHGIINTLQSKTLRISDNTPDGIRSKFIKTE